MSKTQVSELLSLSVRERIRLVQTLWDSIAAVPDSIPLTDREREELDLRLDAYYRDPDAGSPWSEVKKRIQGRG